MECGGWSGGGGMKLGGGWSGGEVGWSGGEWRVEWGMKLGGVEG